MHYSDSKVQVISRYLINYNEGHPLRQFLGTQSKKDTIYLKEKQISCALRILISTGLERNPVRVSDRYGVGNSMYLSEISICCRFQIKQMKFRWKVHELPPVFRWNRSLRCCIAICEKSDMRAKDPTYRGLKRRFRATKPYIPHRAVI